jgi:hypothetical protein
VTTPLTCIGTGTLVYASEINASISWLWDGGIDVKLGDPLNGYIRSAPSLKLSSGSGIRLARSTPTASSRGNMAASSEAQLISAKENLDQDGRECRAACQREQDEVRQLLSRRRPRKLAFDEIELVFDRGEVGAGLIGLTQGERVFV